MPDTISILPPSCFDRADGLNGNLGTPTPVGAILLNCAGGGTNTNLMFEEDSDSPEMEFGEQSTIVHKFTISKTYALYLANTIQRGTQMLDSSGNSTRVLSFKFNPLPKSGGLLYRFILTSEAYSFGTPPDDFDIEVVELNPSIDKHPRYAALTYNDRYIVDGANVSDNIDVAQAYKNLIPNISSSVIQSDDRQGQALELLFKKQKGIDSFYLSGYKVTYSQYFWSVPLINPGGYIEDPVSEGGLPVEFWSTNGSGEFNSSIFAQTSDFNFNMFPVPSGGQPFGLSWLRQTDTVHLQRTWYKLTSTWVGGPYGHWDNELYNRNTQPLETQQDQGGINL